MTRKRLIIYSSIGGGAAGLMVLIYVFFFVGTAVVVYHSVDEAMEALREHHPSVTLRRDPDSGFVAGISDLDFSVSTATSDPTTVNRRAVELVERPEIAAAMGISQTARLIATDNYKDPQVETHRVVRIQQFVDQVRLFGGEIVVSLPTGPSASGTSLTIRPAKLPALNLEARVDEAAARKLAAAHYATLASDRRHRLAIDPPPADVERVIFDPGRFGRAGEPNLAWRVRLGSVQMFVNARDGRIMTAYDTRHTALNRLTHDCSPGPTCTLVLNETGAVITPPHAQDVTRAHDAAATVHRYFRQTFGRDGFDDSLATGGKAPIESFVRIPGLANAQWHPDLLRLEYGAGWMTLDIAAHEYTHAVTQFGPKLEYFGQPGAVNEFFSDFFAAMVEKSTTGNSDWRIGEGVQGFSVQHPLRDMRNPTNGGFNPGLDFDSATNSGQPDHFNKLVTENDRICASIGLLADNGCVHFNSGILNRAMTLAVDGHQVQGQPVTPIPREQVEQIMFRTLMLGGVTASSNLKDAAAGANVACAQLRDAAFRGITNETCKALTLAFAAVGLQ